MKKIKFLIIIFSITFFVSSVKAESNFSLQNYLDKNNIENGEKITMLVMPVMLN